MATKPQLTEKQESFALAYILNGRNASQAYRDVYDLKEDIKDTTVWRRAHEVLHNSKVQARVEVLQLQQYHGDVMTIEERKLLLTKWSREGDGKAVEMLNKMEGVYVEKREISSTSEIRYIAHLPVEDDAETVVFKQVESITSE